jgi:hypothetical protein
MKLSQTTTARPREERTTTTDFVAADMFFQEVLLSADMSSFWPLLAAVDLHLGRFRRR